MKERKASGGMKESRRSEEKHREDEKQIVREG